jgi:hypothetical protein
MFNIEETLNEEIWESCIRPAAKNLKSRLFKELNQPIHYTPKYTFNC